MRKRRIGASRKGNTERANTFLTTARQDASPCAQSPRGIRIHSATYSAIGSAVNSAATTVTTRTMVTGNPKRSAIPAHTPAMSR